MPITNLPPLRRYLDDKQWAVVGRAIKQAGGKINDGNRLHVDSILDLMRSRMPWRDLDPRYGPWASVHFKAVRWYETGILHGITMALFELGLTEEWRPVFTEFSHGISARSGPAIRPLMTQIVVELRRHRDIKVKGGKKAVKLPKPETTIYRDKKKEYATKVKKAVAARKGEVKKVLTAADWALIVSRIPEFEIGPQDNARRQIDELMEVMRTNKGWSYMDPKAGKPSAVYSRFAKWTAEGLMTRLVKCLVELGLTKDWNQFLVATLPKGETSLKLVIGADAYRFMYKPAKKKAGAKRGAAKIKAKAQVAAKERVLKGKAKKTKVATAKAKEAARAKTAKAVKAAKTPTRAAVSGKVTKPAKRSKSAKIEVVSKPKAAKKAAAAATKASLIAKPNAEAVKAKAPAKAPAARNKQPAAPAKNEPKATRSATAKRIRSTARSSGKTKAPIAVVAASKAVKGSKAPAARR
jgi:transposase